MGESFYNNCIEADESKYSRRVVYMSTFIRLFVNKMKDKYIQKKKFMPKVRQLMFLASIYRRNRNWNRCKNLVKI